MPTTSVTENRDAYIRIRTTSHNSARNATTGNFSLNNSSNSNELQHRYWHRYINPSLSYYYIRRTFVYFDLSSISFSSINTLTFSFRIGSSGGSGQFILLESTAFNNGNSNATTADFNNLNFNRTYSSAQVPSTGAGYPSFNLNSNAVTDAENNSALNVAIIDYSYDYLDVQAAPNVNDNTYYNMGSSDTFGLEVDYNTAGPSGILKINDVASSGIAKFDNVTYTDISKINDVG